MLNIQPRKIEAISPTQMMVEFLRVKDNTCIAYMFTFSDNPRCISDYPKEFYFDTMDDMAEIWLTHALHCFDKAREVGVVIGQDGERMVPVCLSIKEDMPDLSLYNVSFISSTGMKDYTVRVVGDSRNREATWEFGSCKTWMEDGQFRFEDITPSFEPLLKAVLRLHEARQFESEVARS